MDRDLIIRMILSLRPDLLDGKDREALTDEELRGLADQAQAEVSLDDVRDLLWQAVQDRYPESDRAWVAEVYPSYLIVERAGKHYRVGWSMLDGEVTLGTEETEVERTWVEARQSQQAETDEDFETLLSLGDPQDPEGLAWDVTICEPGLTKNGWLLTEAVLQGAVDLFEGVDVNLYELPNQGASHIPSVLYDLKALLAKNKAGWIDKVQYIAGEGLKGVLHFLPSYKWLGQNLVAALKNNKPAYGLSFDCGVKAAKDVIEGKSVLRVTKFLAADSVDIVTRPAAGGKFNRAIAAQHKEETVMDREELWQLILTARPDLLEGKDIESITDEELTGIAQMAMKPAATDPPDDGGAANDNPATKDDLDALRCEMALDKKLAKTELPRPAKRRIEAAFKGKVFTTEDLDRAIADEKDYLSALNPNDPGNSDQAVPAGQAGHVGPGTLDQAQMAVDRMFGLTGEDMKALASMERLDFRPFFPDMRAVADYAEFDQVPAFSGIREAYFFFTGDPEVSGRFNRKKMAAGLRSSMEILSDTFTYLLGNTMGRRLVRAYNQIDYLESLFISLRKPVKDFRTQEAVLVGGFPDLADVDPEAADYDEITGVTDEESTYALGQKGNILTISRKTIINDDISIIMRLVDGLGRAARRTHAKYVWDFFVDNSNCSDGTAWFTGGHSNLGSTALSHATAQIAYQFLAKTTEKDSGERIGLLSGGGVKPVLVYPIDLMSTGETIVGEEYYYASNDLTTKTKNPLYGKIAGAMPALLTDANDWGMLMPPALIDMVEMGYLNGRQEPEMFAADTPQSEQVFVADKIRHKVRHEYAGAIVDFRSAYKAEVT